MRVCVCVFLKYKDSVEHFLCVKMTAPIKKPGKSKHHNPQAVDCSNFQSFLSRKLKISLIENRLSVDFNCGAQFQFTSTTTF